MVASLLETILITNIQLSSTHGAIPDWLRTLVLQYVAVVVCLPPSPKKRTVTVFLNPSASGTGGTFLLFTKTLKGGLDFYINCNIFHPKKRIKLVTSKKALVLTLIAPSCGCVRDAD